MPRPDITWTPPPGTSTDQPRQVRRILGLFRPYRGRLAVVGLLVGASSLVGVATPSCSGRSSTSRFRRAAPDC